MSLASHIPDMHSTRQKIVNMLAEHPLKQDLEHILEHTRDLWNALRGQRIFITGGTGFFGCWLLESFVWANRALELNAQAVVLTRDHRAFASKAPHLATDPDIQFVIGDVGSFSFPPGDFAYVIHAATQSSARLNADDPLQMVDTIVQGTRRVLEFASPQSQGGFLLVSSGAVYGRQPPEISHLSEEYCGGPNTLNPGSAYAEGKRTAELLGSIYAQKYAVPVRTARCFAFVGPYLPLDAHFAIGNFIRNGLRGETILVKGDGTPYRSYLYTADLAIWLWTILFRGERGRAYNVGSSHAISIRDLAYLVSQISDDPAPVKILGDPVPGALPERYVPNISRAEGELGLQVYISLEDAIRRTLHWHTGRSVAAPRT